MKKVHKKSKTSQAEVDLKALSRQLKKAKTFECQKIVRKLKKLKYEPSSSSGSNDVQTLEHLLSNIKACDLGELANNILSKNHGTSINKVTESKAPTLSDAQRQATERISNHKLVMDCRKSIITRLSSNKSSSSSSTPSIKVAPKTASESKASKPTTAKTKITKADPTASTFLPSLSTGFTMGESDEEIDDALDLSDDIDSAPVERKNRRGQRARRQIWERKYGSKANHVQKQREAEAQARATIEAKRAQRRQAFAEKELAAELEQQEMTPIVKKRKAKGSAADHPSWLAKKRAVELASTGVAGGGVCGSKIRFDD